MKGGGGGEPAQRQNYEGERERERDVACSAQRQNYEGGNDVAPETDTKLGDGGWGTMCFRHRT